MFVPRFSAVGVFLKDGNPIPLKPNTPNEEISSYWTQLEPSIQEEGRKEGRLQSFPVIAKMVYPSPETAPDDDAVEALEKDQDAPAYYYLLTGPHLREYFQGSAEMVGLLDELLARGEAGGREPRRVSLDELFQAVKGHEIPLKVAFDVIYRFLFREQGALVEINLDEQSSEALARMREALDIQG